LLLLLVVVVVLLLLSDLLFKGFGNKNKIVEQLKQLSYSETNQRDS
jgi:hypothetical protein